MAARLSALSNTNLLAPEVGCRDQGACHYRVWQPRLGIPVPFSKARVPLLVAGETCIPSAHHCKFERFTVGAHREAITGPRHNLTAADSHNVSLA
jgi:hypothetical protein